MKRAIIVYNIRYFVEVDGLQRLYKLEIINTLKAWKKFENTDTLLNKCQLNFTEHTQNILSTYHMKLFNIGERYSLLLN